VTQGGYAKKLSTLEKDIREMQMEVDKKALELECFTVLAECEDHAIPSRMEDIGIQLERVRELEREKQLEYASFLNGRS